MKYFVMSDIHSFYNEMKSALDEAGFDINNNEHILIVCGDIFDRGDQTLEVLNFIKSLPKERRILIRGNHEQLLKDAMMRGYLGRHDFSNGTAKTILHLANSQGYVEWNSIVNDSMENLIHNKDVWDVIDWIASDEWVNYYELDRFIFVHSFIPLAFKDDDHAFWFLNTEQEYNPNWREDYQNRYDWEGAIWGCPWQLIKSGYFDEEAKNGKTLVCGHWHASDFHFHLGDKPVTSDNMLDWMHIYYSDKIIAIDAMTALSKDCNVLVIDEQSNCYDKHGKKLEVEK